MYMSIPLHNKHILHCSIAVIDKTMAEVVLMAIVLSSMLVWSTINGAKCSSNEETCNYSHLLETIQNQLNQIQNKLKELSYESCGEINEFLQYSPSGYYNILADGVNQTVYCNMDELCGENGGWMRIGYLNMSNPSEQCPQEFRLYEENSTRACGRTKNASGCQSVKFPSHNINYTQMCGRVTGYQKGRPNGIGQQNRSPDINRSYVDGVSITKGSSREHVWTFLATRSESDKTGCPCATDSTNNRTITGGQFDFIGDNYFCESGSQFIPPKKSADQYFFIDDPLWDGQDCTLLEAPCCNFTGIPWFSKVLEQPTTDYIELRVCGNNRLHHEDVPVGYYEIYIK